MRLRDGLRPSLGERSERVESDAATYLFHDLHDLHDALMIWLGEEFDPDIALVVLEAVLPVDWSYLPSGAGYETVVADHIPALALHVFLEDADDLEVGEVVRDGPMEATDENVEAARAFLAERWIERSAEKFPGRPAPTDLSDACKFASAFAQRLFGGAIVANEDHQFVVLSGGWILDLCQDASDVAGMTAPYSNDVAMPDEPEWQESMRSVQPRVDEWVSGFVASLTRIPTR